MSTFGTNCFEGDIYCNPNGSTCIIDDQRDVLSAVVSKDLSISKAEDKELNSNKFTSSIDAQSTKPGYDSLNKRADSPNVQTFRVVPANELRLLQNDDSHLQKPILMCFSCKLSFGCLKTFTVHAESHHMLPLKDLEKSLLINDNSSAIVRNNMDEKPQLSFLEPIQTKKTPSNTQLCEDNRNSNSSLQCKKRSPSPTAIPEKRKNLKESASKDSEKLGKSSFVDPENTNIVNKLLDYSMESQHPKMESHIQVEPEQYNSKTEENSLVISTCITEVEHQKQPIEGNTEENMNKNLINYLDPPETSKLKNNIIKIEENEPDLQDSSLIGSGSQSQDDHGFDNITSYCLENVIFNPHNRDSPDRSGLRMNDNCGLDINVNFLNDYLQKQVQNFTKTNFEGIKETDSNDDSKCNAILKPCRSSLSNFTKNSSNIGSIINSNQNNNSNSNNNSINSNGSNGSSSLTIGACSEHLNGRPVGIECTRCEIILNSARLSNSQLSTRNSCKTLKCPQCNWHYKYQETLEIHMREKHPDGESACAFCLAGQQHPRLARGESYSCGYKPYRCEICNYSTTTKGNLSIHMQSDKHLNNIQELNSSQNIVAVALAAGTKGIADAATSISTSNLGATISKIQDPPHSPSTMTSPNTCNNHSINSNCNASLSVNKMSKPNFRCDICCYETSVARNLRIHMTSEKHSHNVVVLQNNLKHFHSLNLVHQQNHIYNTAYKIAEPIKKIENLTDYPISNVNGLMPEVAMADLAYSQALMIQMLQQSAAAAAVAIAAGSNSLNFSNLPQAHQDEQPFVTTKSPPLSPLSVNSTTPETNAAHTTPTTSINSFPSKNDANLLQFLNNSSTSSLSSTNQCINNQSMNSQLTMPDMTDLLPLKPDLWPFKLFSCNVCSNFDTDSLDELNHHIQIDRSRLHLKQNALSNDFTLFIQNNNNYLCRLCNYKTNLKANFQLHSKTDKHLQKLSYVNHIKEGGETNFYKLNFLYHSNSPNYNSMSCVHVKCNSCDFYANSIQKLSLHTQHTQHESASLIFQHFLKTIQLIQLNVSANKEHINDTNQSFNVDSSNCNKLQSINTTFNFMELHCVLCSFKAKNLLEMMQHVKSISHLQLEQLICMQRKYEKLDTLGLDTIFKVVEQNEILAEEDIKNHENANVCHNSQQQNEDEEYATQSKVSEPSSPPRHLSGFNKENDENPQIVLYKCKRCDIFTYNEMEMISHLSKFHESETQEEFIAIPVNFAAMKALQMALMAARLSTEKRLDPKEIDNSNGEAERLSEPDGLKIKIEELNQGKECREEPEVQSDKKRNDAPMKQLRSDLPEGFLSNILNKNNETLNCVDSLEVVCPLCKECFSRRNMLEIHLIEAHTVNKDNVCKILQMVNSSSSISDTESPEPNDSNTDQIFCTDSSIQNHLYSIICQICKKSFKYDEELLKHAQELEHYPMQNLEYLCFAAAFSNIKQCTLTFSSVNSMISHFKDFHMKIIISERHVYKYRCKQCSLAFKTQDKLSVHSVYHRIRDSTRCIECNRNFRSIQSLQKHIESVHCIKTQSDVENFVSTDQAELNTLMEPESKRKKLEHFEKSGNDLDSIDIAQPETEILLQKEDVNNVKEDTSSQEHQNFLKEFANYENISVQTTTPYNIHNMQNLQFFKPQLEPNSTYSTLNTVEMFNIMQFQQLMSMNIMNMAPPLILGQPVTSPCLDASSIDLSNHKQSADINEVQNKQSVDLSNSAQQHSPNILNNNQKRARTRITDEQLKVLRAHFDINNSPSEESLLEMSEKANLPMKVVKHWFRNTLFKERQRNKDSPYNFNNPPSTTLNLEEYEKTGQANVVNFMKSHNTDISNCNSTHIESQAAPHSQYQSQNKISKTSFTAIQVTQKKNETGDITREPNTKNPALDIKKDEKKQFNIQTFEQTKEDNNDEAPSYLSMEMSRGTSQNSLKVCDTRSESESSELHSRPQSPNNIAFQPFGNVSDLMGQQLDSLMSNVSSMGPPKKLQLGRTTEKNVLSSQFDTNSNSSNSSSTSGGKRANRTRFTDYQIKVLQEFFENNSYPKDSDLEYLSKLLLLSPRVIVVWFQNARQKQRKIYENQPNHLVCESEEKKQNINYTCKKCSLVFQRYYELIRHQKNHCFKEENSKKSAKAQIAAAQVAHNLSSEDSNSSMDTHNNSSISKRCSPTVGTAHSIKSISPNSVHNKHQSEFSPATTPTPPRCNSVDSNFEMKNQRFECEKCKKFFETFEQLRDHQIIHHILQSNLFLCAKKNSTKSVGGYGHFDNILQTLQDSPEKNTREQDQHEREHKIIDQHENLEDQHIDTDRGFTNFSSLKLTKKRKFSETSSMDDLSHSELITTLQGETEREEDQFHRKYESFLQYFLHNEENTLIKKKFLTQKQLAPDSETEIEFLQSYYQHNESKKFNNYDFLYEYFLKNSNTTILSSKNINEKPEIEDLIRYYQNNESKKFFQLEASSKTWYENTYVKHINETQMVEFNENFNKFHLKQKQHQIYKQFFESNVTATTNETVKMTRLQDPHCSRNHKNKKNLDNTNKSNGGGTDNRNSDNSIDNNENSDEDHKNDDVEHDDMDEISATISQSSNQNSQEILFDTYDNENTDNDNNSRYELNQSKFSTLDNLGKINASGEGVESLSGVSPKKSIDCKSNKRLRTTILPDQLNILYECYQSDSNPSRKMLEEIAKKVNLKKRVVQVWFQNCRAKDKKSRNQRHYTNQPQESSSAPSPTLDIRDSLSVKPPFLNPLPNNATELKENERNTGIASAFLPTNITGTSDYISNCEICQVHQIDIKSHAFSLDHIRNLKLFLTKTTSSLSLSDKCFKKRNEIATEGHFQVQLVKENICNSSSNLCSENCMPSDLADLDIRETTASPRSEQTEKEEAETCETSDNQSCIPNIIDNLLPRFNQARGASSS